MKKIFGKSLIALVLAMTMIVGTCMSVMAAPAGKNVKEAVCTKHSESAQHVYSLGDTYTITEEGEEGPVLYNYVKCLIYYPKAIWVFACLDEESHQPAVALTADDFADGVYTEGWYYMNGDLLPCDGTHGATTPEITCSSEEAPAPAPAEPPTPDEELRAAEEEALPLVMIETDKSKTINEEMSIVPDKTYNLSAYVTTRGFVSALDKIAKANPKAKKVTIFTSKPFTFNKNIVESINKGGKDVEYYFKHEGDIYSVDIPANVDSSKVLEKNGHAGPLYVGQQLSTTKLRKKKLF